MNLVELFAPKGALSERDQQRLGERLITELISASGAPTDLIERGRGISWLVVHEPEVWVVGGRRIDASEQPRFVVRVSVPGGHLTDGMRAEMVTRITRVLAEHDDAPERFYDAPDAWVQIVEVADGSTGAFGQPLRTRDITAYVVSGDKPPVEQTGQRSPSATVVDPICGMTVEISPDALTLELDGVTYGFCSIACRDLFGAREPAPR